METNLIRLPNPDCVSWDFFALSPKNLARFASLCEMMKSGNRLTKEQKKFVDETSDALAEISESN